MSPRIASPRIAWALHNLVARPLLVLWPALGNRVHAWSARRMESPSPPISSVIGVDFGAAPPTWVAFELAIIRRGPVEKVIATLEAALERARVGDTVAVAIAEQTRDRCDASVYALGTGDIAGLSLAVARVQRRLLDHCEDT